MRGSQMNRRTRKMLAMYQALHARNDVDRLVSIEDYADTRIQELKKFTKLGKKD